MLVICKTSRKKEWKTQEDIIQADALVLPFQHNFYLVRNENKRGIYFTNDKYLVSPEGEAFQRVHQGIMKL